MRYRSIDFYGSQMAETEETAQYVLNRRNSGSITLTNYFTRKKNKGPLKMSFVTMLGQWRSYQA